MHILTMAGISLYLCLSFLHSQKDTVCLNPHVLWESQLFYMFNLSWICIFPSLPSSKPPNNSFKAQKQKNALKITRLFPTVL